jgi:DNA polymerase-3 subunit delta'
MRDAYTVGVLRDPQKKFESLQRLRKWSQEMADSKMGREKQKNFLRYVQAQVRENYIYNLQLPQLNYQTERERTFSERFAPFIHSGNVEAIMEQLQVAEQQIHQNGNAKMIFFDLCLQMIVLIKK